MDKITGRKGPRFTEEEMLSSSGNPEQSFGFEITAVLAKNIAILDAIYIQNPAHRRVFAAYDEILQNGLAAPGQRKLGVRNTGPTGSGKTTSSKEFAAIVEARLKAAGEQADCIRPVVVAALESSCTVRRLWTTVLDAYGDQYSTRGTEELLRKRAYKCIGHFKTQLLVIDEIQHLAHRAREGIAVTDALKRVLDDGIVPLALVGTEDARGMLVGNSQLSNRLIPPCDIRPLDVRDETDRRDFAGFVRRLDAALVDRKLTARASGLDDPRVIACMFEVTQGVIGRVVNLVRVAYSVAFRRGADVIELCDLSTATTTWAVAQGLTPHDPFRAGAGS